MRIVAILTLCVTMLAAELFVRKQYRMGTVATVALEKAVLHHSTKVFKLLADVEHSLSSFDQNAPLYRLNKFGCIDANRHLLEAIVLSKKFYKETDGYFDITIGSITKRLYRFGQDNQVIPSNDALKAAYLNIDGISVDKQRICIKKGITLDLGGMGKGFGVDVAATYLKEVGVKKGYVALWGDIRCFGGCSLYIRSPFAPKPFVELVGKEELGISTSGIYRRFVKSKKYHHLIDPKRLTQGAHFASVTLFGKSTNAALDAYATAISVMDFDEAIRFLKRHKELGAILVDINGKVTYFSLDDVRVRWLFLRKKSNVAPKNKVKSATKSDLSHTGIVSVTALTR